MRSMARAVMVVLLLATVPVLAAGHSEVAELEQFLKKAAKDPAMTAFDIFSARQKLGQAYAEMGDARKAEAAWRETVKLHAKLKEDRDEPAVAGAAAEAAYRLLEPKAKAFLATSVWVAPAKMPADKVLSAQLAQLQKQLTVLLGSADLDPEGMRAAGGLCGDLAQQVSMYKSLDWTYAAALLRAQVFGHMADLVAASRLPEGLPEAKAKQAQALFNQVVARMQQLADTGLNEAWQDAQKRSIQSPGVQALKRELNRYRPTEFPLSRERARTWLDPLDLDAQAALTDKLPLDDVRVCFDRHMASHPDQMLGQVTLTLTVDPQGHVAELQLEGESEQVATCVRQKWRALQDLPHGAAPRLVSLKLQFAAL